MKKILSIEIKHNLEDCPDLSQYGEFSDEKTEGSVEIQNAGHLQYKYFNVAEGFTDDCGSIYKRVQKILSGKIYVFSIIAVAEVQTSINEKELFCQEITSGSLYSIESDCESKYVTEIENKLLDELKCVLSEFGFTKEEMDAIEVIKPEDN